MTPLHAIAVAIPAYEAELSVGEVVRRARRSMENVVVVDDGSSDRTAAAAEAAGARVIRHRRNMGKGRALRTAFTDLFERGVEQVLTLDADGQHLPEDIPLLIDAARSGADLVIGSRDHLFGEMHLVRRTSNRCSSFLISAVAGRRIFDFQSGFRLYTTSLIDATGFPEPRFEAESAVAVRAIRFGFRVATVPIRLGFADGRATSHYRPVIDSLRIAGAVVRARLETMGCPVKRSW